MFRGPPLLDEPPPAPRDVRRFGGFWAQFLLGTSGGVALLCAGLLGAEMLRTRTAHRDDLLALVIGCALGLLLSISAFLVARRWRRTYRYGVSTRARVIRVVLTTGEESDEQGRTMPVFKMIYEFDTQSGRFTGSLRTVTPAAVGEQIWVIYDPKRPRLNLPA
jgi:hypothetical protein